MTGHSMSVLVPCSCFGFRPSAILQKGHSSPLLFSPCLLWPNCRPSQLYCWALVAQLTAKCIVGYIFIIM